MLSREFQFDSLLRWIQPHDAETANLSGAGGLAFFRRAAGRARLGFPLGRQHGTERGNIGAPAGALRNRRLAALTRNGAGGADSLAKLYLRSAAGDVGHA